MDRPVYYLQWDNRWGKLPFTNHNDLKQTIGTSGCGITCAAMILATLLKDSTILPDSTAKLAVDNGYRTYNLGTDFKFFPFIAERFGLKLIESYSTNEAIQHLQQGDLVICSMTGIKDKKGNIIAPGHFTKNGHFILAYGVQDGCIFVNDPNHNDDAHSKATISVFQKECQKYFIFERGESIMADVQQPAILNWEQIIEKVSDGSAEEWKNAVNVAAKAAEADGNLGPLEIFKYLPNLIEKVYESK